MATSHTFRTVGGRLKISTLTPIKAIREHCVECVQSIYAVEDCRGEFCALFPYRLGKRPDGDDEKNAEGQLGGQRGL